MPERDAESCDRTILRDIRIAEEQLGRSEGIPHEEVKRRMLERLDSWAREAEHRYRQLKSNQTEAIPSADVFREARARLAATSRPDPRRD